MPPPRKFGDRDGTQSLEPKRIDDAAVRNLSSMVAI